jgi:cystathionine gamma-synthase
MELQLMTQPDRDHRIETLSVRAGRSIDPATAGIAQPIQLSTTFAREADGSYPHGYTYICHGNPTRAALQDCLTALEGGALTACFASGTAAAMSVFQALGPDAHVIVCRDAYHGVIALLGDLMEPWRLAVSYVDTTDLDAVEAAFTPRTRLLWVETPSNPLLKVSDLATLAEIAHAHGALGICDNTFATPVLQRPFEHGFDLVMHSTTKYIGGHSDVAGGAIIAAEESDFSSRLCELQTLAGAAPSPFDCWLLLRGAATLPIRIRTQANNARKLAEFLDEHPAVETVFYPGLPQHSGYAVAKRQMKAFGGMLSFTVRGGEAAAMRAAANAKLLTRATSLGGVESLIEHRRSMEGPESRTPANLLRISTGIEHNSDLIADLDQALKQL